MRSSTHPRSRRVLQGRPSDNDKVLYGFILPGSSQSSQTQRPSRSAKIISLPPLPLAPTAPPLRLYSFVIGSAFVSTSTSVGRTRQSKLPCLGSSSKLSFKGVLVTQELLWRISGVELSKILSTSGRKFKIGRLTLSPIHLHQVWYWRGSRRVPPHSILLRRTQALGQGPDGTTRERDR